MGMEPTWENAATAVMSEAIVHHHSTETDPLWAAGWGGADSAVVLTGAKSPPSAEVLGQNGGRVRSPSSRRAVQRAVGSSFLPFLSLSPK